MFHKIRLNLYESKKFDIFIIKREVLWYAVLKYYIRQRNIKIIMEKRRRKKFAVIIIIIVFSKQCCGDVNFIDQQI